MDSDIAVRDSGVNPWGQMTLDRLQLLNPPGIPTDFRLTASESSRVEAWLTWRRHVLQEIGETLWPTWVPGEKPCTARWVGRSHSQMISLTAVDLELIVNTQRGSWAREFYRRIRSDLRTPDCPDHSVLFAAEDGDSPAATFAFYDRTLQEHDVDKAMALLYAQGMGAKVSSVSTQFKYHLQRPRPYQMALQLGFDEFPYQQAVTAATPSMCSGHAVQSLLAVGGILETWLEEGILGENNCGKRLALQQWAVDVGDRRVLAGVHYPSDNLCSWLIFLRLADRVYFRPEIKRWMWDAIRQQSFVYRLIRQRRAHVYAEVLQAIEAAATANPPAGLASDPMSIQVP